MMALEGGEKAATAAVYKRRPEAQRRRRTWRDGGTIVDPFDAKVKEKEEQSLVGRATQITFMRNTARTWSILSFTTITFYFIVLRTNPFENNIDCRMDPFHKSCIATDLASLHYVTFIVRLQTI
jgi:hypothetical protein